MKKLILLTVSTTFLFSSVALAQITLKNHRCYGYDYMECNMGVCVCKNNNKNVSASRSKTKNKGKQPAEKPKTRKSK